MVTQPDRPAGRGKQLRRSAVAALADTQGLEVLQPERAGEASFVDRLRELAPDLAVVVAYGRILPTRVLEVPALGCINAHASLLPLLRGAAPIQHAILEGHERTGVTIMQLDPEMDAGDMLLRGEIPIGATDDAGDLAHRLSTLSAELLVRAIDEIAAGRAHPETQDHARATYAPPITAEHTRMDWTEDADRCERRVRAVRPRPGAFTFDDGKRLKVLRSHVVDAPGGDPPGTAVQLTGDALVVTCGRGALALDIVQPEGRKAMSGADYQRGCGVALPRALGEPPARP